MKLKKGIVSVNGNEIEQFVIEDKKDIDSFLKKFPQMRALSLKDTFQEIINDGDIVILDTNENRIGFYSWRTVGKENWKLIRILN